MAVDGHKSGKMTVTSGVPQGSVLGPLLFLMHLGDIDENVGVSVISSFADDTSVSHAFTCSDDINHMQDDLNTVYKWAETNNMQFNEEKFELLRYGPNSAIREDTALHTEGGFTITPKKAVKCLGVYLSEDGSYKQHITEVIKKARGMAGWVLRTFASREPGVMLTLWQALVQPIMDYCSQLWSPQKKGEIQRLEAVQRSFTRQIEGMKLLNYWDRLKKLKMYSQQRRRDRYRAIYIWKVIENLVPDPTNSELQSYLSERTGRKCKRRALPSRAPEKVKSLLTASLSYEGPRIFNSLPKHTRNLSGCSVEKFKASLDKFLTILPDEPPVPGYTASCRAASNSIPDQVDLKNRDARIGSSGGPPRL